jgi:AbiV family abortive infection protein
MTLASHQTLDKICAVSGMCGRQSEASAAPEAIAHDGAVPVCDSVGVAMETGAMFVRKLPDLKPAQVVELQDALLANADRLLTSALAVLDLGNVGLARSLAILGVEESGKAIAIHERRVQMAYAPEGEPFVNSRLEGLWASHRDKLELVHDFLTEERYWFDTEPSDPEANRAKLGAIKAWARRHDKLKLRGFYVDIDRAGGVLTPVGVAEEKSLADVISHLHQVGWQLRLGEHIEAKQQASAAQGAPPASEDEIVRMREVFSGLPGGEHDEAFFDSMRQGTEGTRLNNDAYRLHLPDPDANPFENLGKSGYEAETRELLRLTEELDEEEDL